MTDTWRRGTVLRSAAALACALLGSSCAFFGGQTGQEDSHEPPIDCAYEPMPISADTVTQLGFSSAEVETLLATPASESLLWFRMNTRSRLTLELLETGARFLKVSTNGTCPDMLELEARVAIRTEDGLLDEQLVATVEADAVDHATLTAEVAPEAIAGTLTPEILDLDPSNWSDPRLSIRLERSAQGIALRGAIYLDGDDPNPNDSSSPVSAAIAELPAP